MKKRKCQASVEFVIIIGFIMLIIIPLVIVFYQHSRNINDQVITSQVDKIGRKIIDNAESVYYLGYPSKTSLRIFMPENVNEVVIEDMEITFKVSTQAGVTEMSYTSPVNITGGFPTTKGIHQIHIESKGDYVWIGE